MELWLIGIVLVVIGLLVCVAGLRWWFVLLPLIAGVVGFALGTWAVQTLFGTSFLATAASWLAGLAVGVGFGALSWFLWYAGVVILAGALGAGLASGLLHALFPDPWGWALFLVTLLGAVIGGVLALLLHLPSYLVVVTSAFVGAALVVAGVMTLLGTITVGELANGVAIAVVDEAKFQGASWLWVLGWLLLGFAGLAIQLQGLAATGLPERRWVRAQTP
jgi:hypothetical protein